MPSDGFLPDFCHPRSVYSTVIVCELFGIVLAVFGGLGDGFWQRLGLVSMFVLWVALLSSAVLCKLRPYLVDLSERRALVASYLVVIAITGLTSFAAAELLPFDAWEISKPTFYLKNLTIAAIVAAVVLHYLYIQYQWREKIETETEARIEALQARIRPHFLFNSMNTIAALIRQDPDIAEDTVADLADLFRASLKTDKSKVPLAQELELAQQYMNIEKLRLGDRLKVEFDTEEAPRDAMIPPLTLQPLLENAVYHGVEPDVNGGDIYLEVEQVKSDIYIEISNSLPASGARSTRTGNNVAQDNIRQRLLLAYHRGGTLELEKRDGRYYSTIVIPYNRERT